MPKRQALRQRYGLQEDCNDCVATTCCAPCAVCQEARELKFRSAPSGGRWIYKEFAYISLNIIFYLFRTGTSYSTTNGRKFVSITWTTRNDTRTISITYLINSFSLIS